MVRHVLARHTGACLAMLLPCALAWAGPVPEPSAETDRAASAAETTATTANQPVVELKKSINVYTEPTGKRSHFLGTIVRGSRVSILEQKSARGKNCKGTWLRIDTRAWLCSRFTRPTDEPPGATPLAGLQADDLLPKEYMVTRDAPVYSSLSDAVSDTGKQTIRGLGGFVQGRTVRRNGKRYVKTPHGWVPASEIQSVEASTFKGVELSAEDRGKRLAFVRVKRARLYHANGKRLRERGPTMQTYLGEIGAPVQVGRGKRARTLYPLDDDRFVRAEDISLIEWTEVPDEIRPHGTSVDSAVDEKTPASQRRPVSQRWIDVSVSRQLLVAYEGRDPVMATLVSTGRTATTPGVYRIQKKRAYGRLRAKPEYRTQWDVHVPWVMTLDGRLAMHTVYWHDNFGKPFSQGCVNLAPIDAKWLWDFTEPTLPTGWVRVESDDDQAPGTVVRIRK